MGELTGIQYLFPALCWSTFAIIGKILAGSSPVTEMQCLQANRGALSVATCFLSRWGGIALPLGSMSGGDESVLCFSC